VPLNSLTTELAYGGLFEDADVVFRVWNAIQELFSGSQGLKALEVIKRGQRGAVVVCYDGDASRMVSSTLRHQGIEAFSVKGGFGGLMSVIGMKMAFSS